MTRIVTGSKLVSFIALLLLAGAVLASCNTTKGFGEDLEEAGEGIQDAADD